MVLWFLKSPLSLLCVALTGIIGCAEETTTGIPQDPHAPGNVAPSGAQALELAGEPAFLELGQEVPGFGGFFFSEQGDVIVYLTDPALLDAARSRIHTLIAGRLDGARTPSGMGDRFVVRQADYTFLELARYRTLLRDEIFSIAAVVSLGVDESINRVRVGIAEPSAEEKVRSLLTSLDIPTDAVTFSSEEYADPLNHNLDYHHPDDVIQGGWNAWCTIGFAAYWDDGTEVWLTSSHCTDVMYGSDDKVFYQPAGSTSRIGQELYDPPAYSCWAVNGCRKSDAAIIKAEATIDLGTIARTEQYSWDPSQYGSLEIDHDNPVFTITSKAYDNLEGEFLDKVGHKSGWTYGEVLETCSDVTLTDGYLRECSDKVEAMADEGDSGSPAFFWKADGSAELRGVVFGSNVGNYYWMSDLRQIEGDLGSLIVVAKSVSAEITGMSSVPPNTNVQWCSDVDYGRPPYSYEWHRNGALVSTSECYMGNTGYVDFKLELKVTDGQSDVDTDTHYVTVEDTGTESVER